MHILYFGAIAVVFFILVGLFGKILGERNRKEKITAGVKDSIIE
jgi:hypothetical protein